MSDDYRYDEDTEDDGRTPEEDQAGENPVGIDDPDPDGEAG